MNPNEQAKIIMMEVYSLDEEEYEEYREKIEKTFSYSYILLSAHLHAAWRSYLEVISKTIMKYKR